MPKCVGYARVSTVGQEQNGNSLTDQQEQLTQAGAQTIYADACSGKRMDRPQFTRMLTTLEPGDRLIVCKLDRFARTAAEGAATIQGLLKRGIIVDVLNLGRLDDTPMGRLLMQVLFCFAEFERAQIIERTQAGRKQAIKNGVKMGRPMKYDPDRLTQCLNMIDAGSTYSSVCKLTGISKSTLIRAKRERTAITAATATT